MAAKRLVFPEGEDERILKACSIIAKQKIAKIILLGDIDKILGKIEKLKLNFNASIINPEHSENFSFYAEELVRIRKKHNLSYKNACKLVQNPEYFACMMLHGGDCDAVISGAVVGTPNFLRPAFQIIKTKKGISRASAAVFMILKNKTLLFSDISVQINPNAQELAEIAMLSAKTFEKFIKKRAKVAMLSFSTHDRNNEYAEKMRKGAEIAKRKNPGLIIDGEVQVDAALVPEVSKRKKSMLEGEANVLIFPDLNSGNISYKLVERLAGAKAACMIIQGLQKPIVLLSRGCSIQDIIGASKLAVK